jgi:hypothetical protein
MATLSDQLANRPIDILPGNADIYGSKGAVFGELDAQEWRQDLGRVMFRKRIKTTSCAVLADIANAETLSDDDTNNWAMRRGRGAI